MITDKLTIKSWSEEDRPREKLLLKGRASLSDAELIAILIGSGNREQSAVELSRQILQSASNNLHELSRWEVSEYMRFKGIGEAKAISIIAALEIGRRKTATTPLDKPQLSSSHEAYQVMHPILADLNHEEFWVVYLNNNNRVIAKEKISQGGLNKTIVDTRIIMKKALMHLASSIILVHNHPSGNLKPSQSDLDLTRKLKQGADVLDIKLVDHLIITQGEYYSFGDEGKL